MNKKIKNKYANPKTPSKKKKNVSSNSDTIDLDNEIIIGLTTKKKEIKDKKNKVKKNVQVKKKSTTKKKKVLSKKEIIRRKIIKWTTLVMLLVIVIILFLLSDLFNVKQIMVKNNSKISADRIIELSQITNVDNIFKISKKTVMANIMKEPYIENVKIKRSLTGILTLEIIERETTYMLEFANAYVYIDNQGYILEISDNKVEEVPILTGIETQSENIKVGNRLINNDLEKLQTVIKIIEEAKNNQVANLITKIDISNSKNFLMYLSTEAKTVHFGDSTNINEKILWMKKIVEAEKGKEGEILIEETKGRTYFREKV